MCKNMVEKSISELGETREKFLSDEIDLREYGGKLERILLNLANALFVESSIKTVKKIHKQFEEKLRE